MAKNKWKGLLALGLGLSMSFSVMTTVGAADTEMEGEVTLWTKVGQEELDGIIQNFNDYYPNIKVNPVIIPSENYMTKLSTALRSGVGAPDVFILADIQLGTLAETEYIENLSQEPYNADELMDDYFPYVSELCKDAEGNVKGLSYQACPGGFWYNKALAKEYLGTDDADELSEMFSSWDNVIAKSAEVYEKSGGEVYLLDSITAVWVPMVGAKGESYVVDGKITGLDYYKEIMEVGVQVRANNGDTCNDAWGPAWAASMYEDQSFILLGMPSWALGAAIKANTPSDATDTEGTWGFCQAPASYRDGGSFMSIYSGSENKEAAWAFVSTITANAEYDADFMKRRGEFVAYKPAVEKLIEEGYNDPMIGGQNLYQAMYDAAMNVTPIKITKYDSAIKDTFTAKFNEAVLGNMTTEEAFDSFIKDVQAQFPELIAE